MSTQPPTSLRLDRQFERRAARTPDRIAIVSGGESLTYEELGRRANQLARHLSRRGVGPETMVGVYLDRSVDLAVAVLGVLKAGGVCVPLSPSSSTERIARRAQETQPRVLIANAGVPDAVRRSAPEALLLRARDLIARELTTDLAAPVSPEHAAFVFFTSGSTGTSLPVVFTHRAACLGQLPGVSPYGPSADDRVLLLALGGVNLLGELFGPWLAGATVVAANPGRHQDGTYLVDTVLRQRITRMSVTPAVLRRFLHTPGVEACTGLRDVFCRGEELSYSLQRRFFAQLPARLHHVYGQTETGSGSSWRCYPDAPPGPVPIGRRSERSAVRLLDEDLQPVPVDVAAEIYVAGPRHARGYLDRPELTVAKFLLDPHQPGGWLCRTGDVARYRADGTIEFLGRRADELIVGNLRFYPREIERAMCAHPLVDEALVARRPDDRGHTQLTAYVLPAGTTRLPMEALQSLVREHYPAQLVPSAVVWMESWPLAVSGKVDRAALPLPKCTPSCAYVAAQESSQDPQLG